jgi:hypothetical protein
LHFAPEFTICKVRTVDPVIVDHTVMGTTVVGTGSTNVQGWERTTISVAQCPSRG